MLYISPFTKNLYAKRLVKHDLSGNQRVQLIYAIEDLAGHIGRMASAMRVSAIVRGVPQDEKCRRYNGRYDGVLILSHYLRGELDEALQDTMYGGNALNTYEIAENPKLVRLSPQYYERLLKEIALTDEQLHGLENQVESWIETGSRHLKAIEVEMTKAPAQEGYVDEIVYVSSVITGLHLALQLLNGTLQSIYPEPEGNLS
ncbi:hypothetical protein HNP46_000510 [Pseudomonas nitritireducens]|uniref:Uncharacterized protein n=1 Tax=Pseudomonas nitroreducens TaxID=46680 RepID=A0A7W7KG60_PSENT|nr:hypothetical protein [Pseudomonas nitritireducens]MBB4861699.1 hypothetical protein [Pseudomonas nitritireducens]